MAGEGREEKVEEEEGEGYTGFFEPNEPEGVSLKLIGIFLGVAGMLLNFGLAYEQYKVRERLQNKLIHHGEPTEMINCDPDAFKEFCDAMIESGLPGQFDLPRSGRYKICKTGDFINGKWEFLK